MPFLGTAPLSAQSSSPPPSSAPEYEPPISNNAPGFRYKYPGAKPTPPGVDDQEWNKIYTAADSRFYNKHGKNSTESKKYRDRGETYTLALKMLEEKREKRKREMEGGGPPPKVKKVAPPKQPATIMKEQSSSSRDVTPGADNLSMGIAEKIKSQGRARKQSSLPPSSDRGTPAPSTSAQATTPPKTVASESKKKGTAQPVKKPVPKPKPQGMYMSVTILQITLPEYCVNFGSLSQKYTVYAQDRRQTCYSCKLSTPQSDSSPQKYRFF
jgi:COMPASS component SPP1